MKSLKIFAVSTMLASGVSMAAFATSAGDPSYNNTTNMDNTGMSAPADSRINDQQRAKPMPTDDTRKVTVPANNVTAADKVRSVQEALRAEGHDIGVSDGILGNRTSAALREYQRNNNLTVTGKINQETLDRLGLEFGAEQQNDTNTFAE